MLTEEESDEAVFFLILKSYISHNIAVDLILIAIESARELM